MTPLHPHDDENEAYFTLKGREYASFSLDLDEFCDDLYTFREDMFTEIPVMTTPKFGSIMPTLSDCPGDFFFSNFTTDRRPFNEYGRIKGSTPLPSEARVIWRME